MRRFAQVNAPLVARRARCNPTLTAWLSFGPVAALLALLV